MIFKLLSEELGMDKNIINYTWDEDSQDLQDEDSLTSEVNKTRKDLQIARRLFHMGNGVFFASIYAILLSHSQMVHFLGAMACILYLIEQIRISYPELQEKLQFVTKFIMRAEEQLKESAMVPYAFAILLTIISFPKVIALSAIYTLAIADPLSAIIGIKYGKRRIVPHKSLEGSAAFFVATFFCILIPFLASYSSFDMEILILSLVAAFIVSAFEMLPLRLDDNLTIPLFSAATLWILCAILGLPI
jgi:dolichol kinase